MAKKGTKKPETRGRKPLPPGEKRVERIVFKATVDERQAIQKQADQHGLVMSEWCRRRALGEL